MRPKPPPHSPSSYSRRTGCSSAASENHGIQLGTFCSHETDPAAGCCATTASRPLVFFIFFYAKRERDMRTHDACKYCRAHLRGKACGRDTLLRCAVLRFTVYIQCNLLKSRTHYHHTNAITNVHTYIATQSASVWKRKRPQQRLSIDALGGYAKWQVAAALQTCTRTHTNKTYTSTHNAHADRRLPCICNVV